MEKHLSQNELQKFYNQQIRKIGKKELGIVVKEIRTTEKDSKKRKSIFLSHSHLDKTIVNKIALLFNEVNFEIYVDWMDKAMPKVTDKHTAILIKDKIEHCSKFLFLATSRGLQSKWCNWEIGLAYSLKNEHEIAILPIQSKSGIWKGSEYLHLFPELEFDVNELAAVTAKNIRIRYSKSQVISLEKWLAHN